MPHRSRRTSHAAALALVAAAALASGCKDDPSCIFTTGCQGDSGPGALGNPASLPEDGQLVLPGLPEIDMTYPNGVGQSSTSPILVVFSESMGPDTIGGQIEVVQLDLGGFPLLSVPSTQTLAAGGRVLVILPLAALTPADYVVRVADTGALFDLTGQEVSIAGGTQLASFQVDVDDPVEPAVVMTFPADGESRPGTTTPILVAFDRPIALPTITDGSFSVLAGGAAPAFDPPPSPLSFGSSVLPVTDLRVLIYRSVDGDGQPVSLGTDTTVDLVLSPLGDPIEDEAGEVLPETSISFVTQVIDPPLDAGILSTPSDGIGIANLTEGDAEELSIQVDLGAAEPGDEVLVTLFGDSKDEEPQLFALSRSKEAEGAAPITAVNLSLADLDLTTAPGEARFADGSLSFAFALRRGSQTTSLRVLDVDPGVPGIQDPVLDTVAPVLTELLSPGMGVVAEFRSDQRDLVLTGVASEPVRSIEVVTPMGDNGTLAPAVGANDDGLFVAAPVTVGLLSDGGPLDYDVTVYDRVFNASATASGVATQSGWAGGSPLVPDGPIDVRVVDAVTLEPIAGASVFTHEDAGDGVNYPLRDSALTDAGGQAQVLAASAGAVGTLLTVEVADYGPFTFHGLTVDTLSVPLRPNGLGAASVVGSVGTESSFAELTLPLVQKKVGDSRRLPGSLPAFDGDDCISDPFGGLPLTCPFGPEAILADRLGAQAFLAGNFLLDEGTFSAGTLIQAFDLVIPRPAVAPAGLDESTISVPFLLTEPGLDPSELPVELPATTFSGALATGVNLADLAGDPATTGDPRISVEALVPGIPGSTTVGLGLAFDQGGGLWNLRAAYPGALTDAGFFGSMGAVDTNLLLRAELRDGAGNRAGQRPRIESLDSLPVPFSLFAVGVPAITSPLETDMVTAPFTVVFANSLPDIAGQPGLYVVTVVDATGRTWTLMTPDPPDGAIARVHLPDLGGTRPPLADGPLTASVSAFAWSGFDVGSFLFSDIEREHDLFGHGIGVTFTQVP